MLSNSITQIYQNKQLVANRNFSAALIKFIRFVQILTTAFKLFLLLENGLCLVFRHIKQYKLLLLSPLTLNLKGVFPSLLCVDLLVCLLASHFICASVSKCFKRLRNEKLIRLWNWQFLEKKVVYFLILSIVFAFFEENFTLNYHGAI